MDSTLPTTYIAYGMLSKSKLKLICQALISQIRFARNVANTPHLTAHCHQARNNTDVAVTPLITPVPIAIALEEVNYWAIANLRRKSLPSDGKRTIPKDTAPPKNANSKSVKKLKNK